MKKHDYSWNDVYVDLEKPCTTSKITNHFTQIDDVMKKSVLIPGFEKLERIPNFNKSEKMLKMERKKERAKTKGSDWYNLPATPITPELENDLKVIQMRSALDTKHFYKKNDMKVLPKYFQIGKVVDSPADFYHNRVPKKERKRTIVEELLADAEFQKKNRRKYKEIIEQKKKSHYKAHKHAQKLKRKNRKK